MTMNSLSMHNLAAGARAYHVVSLVIGIRGEGKKKCTHSIAHQFPFYNVHHTGNPTLRQAERGDTVTLLTQVPLS